jgi:hypothetical protein
MAAATCPSCGNELPEELRQHALTPESGLVQCPHCGETVALDAPEEGVSGDVPRAAESVGGEEGAPEEFSGSTTIEGVKEEIEDKPGGGEAEL